MQNLAQEDFLGLLYACPPVLEQARVASFLDHETAKIDALIQEQQRLIELLKEKRQAVISHAVTQGLDPTVPMKDSGVEWLGEVPAHWQVMPIKHLINSISQGWSPDCDARIPERGEWGVVKVGCVNGGVFRPDESKALPANVQPRPELQLREGDVLVSRANTRDLVGSCAVVPYSFPHLMLCDKLYRLDCGSAVIPEFLAAVVTIYGRRVVEIEATGASSSMVNIAQSVVQNIVVAAPPTKEQRAIISRVSALTSDNDRLRAQVDQALVLLRERRSALISAAVTGKIDVRKWKPPADDSAFDEEIRQAGLESVS